MFRTLARRILYDVTEDTVIKMMTIGTFTGAGIATVTCNNPKHVPLATTGGAIFGWFAGAFYPITIMLSPIYGMVLLRQRYLLKKTTGSKVPND